MRAENRKATLSEREKEWLKKIKAQCKVLSDGWIDLKLKPTADGQSASEMVQVARIPFERWMRNTHFHRENDWKNAVPFGAKMQMDNADHSDWWLSTGISLSLSYYDAWARESELKNIQTSGGLTDIYGDPIKIGKRLEQKMILACQVNSASWSYRLKLGSKTGEYVFLVNPRADQEITSRVWHVPNVDAINEFVDRAQSWKRASNSQEFVAIIPHAGIEYDAVIRNACAIITQVGSKAAHLVKVAREDSIPVILCEDALTRYFHYEKITIKKDYIYRNG